MAIITDTRMPYVKRMVRCPQHYLVDPKQDLYEREIDPNLRGVSKDAVKSFGINRFRKKRDAYGYPVWNKKAIIFQPEKSAAYLIEHVYDPASHICIRCGGRCLEGTGGVNTSTIKRLNF